MRAASPGSIVLCYINQLDSAELVIKMQRRRLDSESGMAVG